MNLFTDIYESPVGPLQMISDDRNLCLLKYFRNDKTEELMRKFGQFVDDLGGKYITACISLTKVWIMGTSAGVTAEMRAAVVENTHIPTVVFPL